MRALIFSRTVNSPPLTQAKLLHCRLRSQKLTVARVFLVTVCRGDGGGWRAERLHHPAPGAPRRQRRAGLAAAPARHPGAAGGAAAAAGQQQRPAGAHGAHRGGQQRRRGRRSAHPRVPERGKLRKINHLKQWAHFILL